ncbi:MAG: TIGR01212 family radical SAM protein [Candidatus Obscuribacterales bacterium]|jgi:radical SAM protein (TIGR01212 family)|nr:TIGR01212 family radical SAM protein [Candidatus Obscuribacterales bacterium]
MQHSYRTFNNYLLEKFGVRVYRVPIDVGFDCPNRDGSRAVGGCTFCDERGSGAPTINAAVNVRQQLIDGVERIRERYKAKKFLTYFQAFTNTYAPEGILRVLYESGLEHPDVVGLCIGTRPDCVPDNVLDLLAEFDKKTFVWLEMGLQSAHNKTLDVINRAHSSEEFFDALARAQARGLACATHLIFGLPGEDREMMMETVKRVAVSGVDGIKIHQLCVYKGAPMEMDYRLGNLKLLDEDYYVELVADAIELLPPEMIIMRLVAEGKKDELIAPTWSYDKYSVIDKIEYELRRRNTKQGSRFHESVAFAGAPRNFAAVGNSIA